MTYYKHFLKALIRYILNLLKRIKISMSSAKIPI